MKVMNLVQAINDAMDIKLKEDKSIVVYGEDVGVEGGVFRVTEGLQEKHGADRVFDSPLAESGIAGTALGMAISGMKPIIEMQFDGFSYPAFNQIFSHISRFRNRTRGKFTVPMVIRIPYGGGINALEHHSESPEAYFGHTPGLKVVIPSTPYDAKGLLISAIEDPDPVIFMEPKRIYRAIKQEVPDEIYRIPLGKAKVLQDGSQITVIAYGAMVREAQKAIAMAKAKDYSVELIDLRSIWPIDRETISKSVRKTGRALVVTEAPQSYGPAAELISIINEEAFLSLEAPPTRLTGFDTVIPLPLGEKHYMINPERISAEIERLIRY
ncbi:MAG: alpha-ketoacid dehydrogenase subunit beta [Candidatus Cloacimonadales bacterium]|jgi:pyruvate dehydrogenase E1 component beta subunit|nr:alpha-ketoacid dehydrogenase subunit beta [Candidatus Cloacimonadota bacterium]MDY0381968.1 alpha-ketoacid dehydrogenase subunit beta [Candidatus Cloacimonadaceae bacterium]MCB5257166.1 alpha-ketoacid dehydrogenase subunit beta [Candidatus Cloacimonadota bacterium]MCB5276520.1 alpha-ketoacid dehydrogenase subunit beta [Candidatus Cloacimonadota bacterium]MCK9434696.1 alpha-ketoacid dehydrogenase subunit beta [Candidatus Cloacimonadota bacterium]